MSEAADTRRTALLVAAFALALALALGGQAGTDAFAPGGRVADTGRMIGRTGDAYLSGLRVFAAQVLWNRLEPQFHGYYSQLPLRQQKFLMPNLRLVVLLDPQFVQAYYDIPWILFDNGMKAEALDVAREGIANNPQSGLLRVSYAQYLFLFVKDNAAAAKQADITLTPQIVWKDEVEYWEGLRVIEDIYRHAGETAKADRVAEEMKALEAKYGGSANIPGDRDTDSVKH